MEFVFKQHSFLSPGVDNKIEFVDFEHLREKLYVKIDIILSED